MKYILNIDNDSIEMWETFSKLLDKAFKNYKKALIREVTFGFIGYYNNPVKTVCVKLIMGQPMRCRPKRMFEEFNHNQHNYWIRTDFITHTKLKKNFHIYHITIEETYEKAGLI